MTDEGHEKKGDRYSVKAPVKSEKKKKKKTEEKRKERKKKKQTKATTRTKADDNTQLCGEREAREGKQFVWLVKLNSFVLRVIGYASFSVALSVVVRCMHYTHAQQIKRSELR